MHQPTKEAVRKFMQQRQVERKPPPSMEEIRRQLGWNLIPHNANSGARDEL